MFNLVETVGSSLSLKMNVDMVDACQRLGKKLDTNGKPRGIIVKFTRRTVKKEIVKKRRVKRNLNTTNIGFPIPSRLIYMNESLTQTICHVFNAVQELKKEKRFTFVWVRNDKILVRLSEGDNVIVVTNMDDVKELGQFLHNCTKHREETRHN